MKVWAITFQEFGGAAEIVHDGSKFLLFEDSAAGYAKALRAFQAVVRDRIGTRATYSYPGEIGQDARAHIVVRELSEHDECCGYDGDTIELRPYDVIGG